MVSAISFGVRNVSPGASFQGVVCVALPQNRQRVGTAERQRSGRSCPGQQNGSRATKRRGPGDKVPSGAHIFSNNGHRRRGDRMRGGGGREAAAARDLARTQRRRRRCAAFDGVCTAHAPPPHQHAEWAQRPWLQRDVNFGQPYCVVLCGGLFALLQKRDRQMRSCAAGRRPASSGCCCAAASGAAELIWGAWCGVGGGASASTRREMRTSRGGNFTRGVGLRA